MRWPLGKGERANAPEAWDADDVVGFIQGGGRFTLDEWARMDPETRANVAEIGRAHLADLVATLARAIHDPDFASRLGSRADGGEQRSADAMTQALAAVAAKIHGGPR